MARINLSVLVLMFICALFLVVPVSATVTQYNITDGAYTVHIFNGTGNSTWTVPTGITSAWVMVVGGGGAGGGGSGADGNNYGGGGGAGALLNGTMVLVPTASIALTVGDGGDSGLNGYFSQFNNTEIASGGGGGSGAGGTTTNGKQGGSGGGAGAVTPAGFIGGSSNATSGLSLTAYGNRGGYSVANDPGGAGGGGGALGSGINGTASTGGFGGTCFQSSITGSARNYSAGGSGNRYQTQTVGICADTGGASSTDSLTGQHGTDGTGSGGGGSWSTKAKLSGGSGVIIVRYLTLAAPATTFTTNTTGGIAASITAMLNDTTVINPAVSSWSWTFQNVTPGNNTVTEFSTSNNVTYTFGIGNWLIKLNATNSIGYNISTQTTFINVTPPASPVSSFTANQTSGNEPYPVKFNDTSTYLPTSWNWSFNNVTGNNTQVWFSQVQNPVHIFGVGNYSIKLDASNAYGSNISTQTTFINVTTPPPPVSSFTANQTSGKEPYPVKFNDTSTLIPTSWNWSFNNVTGNNTQVWFSTSQNVTRTFLVGNYSIKLTASNAYGSDISAQTTFINVSSAAPVASYSANKSSGAEPLLVGFTDSTSNSPTSWSWTFQNVTPGNNSVVQFSTAMSPSYTFLVGNYKIGLTSTNAYGTSTAAQTTFVNVSSTAPVASYNVNTTSGVEPLPVGFTDSSTNSPTSWSWTFQNVTPGNNSVVQFSTAMSPSYTFLVGNYKIGLTSTNAYGTSTAAQTTFVNVSALSAPVANFTANRTSARVGDYILFSDSSTGNHITTWAWDFGDAITSSDQNPVHSYAYADLYTVTLTVTNIVGGNNMKTRTDYISINLSARNSTHVDIAGTPKMVQFHVQTIWGAPLPGALVQIHGIETTTGSWDWVLSLLGLALDEAPIQNTLLQGTTDSMGNTEFMMVPTTKYNVSTTLAGHTFPVLYIVPHDNEYVIAANLLGDGWVAPEVAVTGEKNITVTQVRTSDTVQNILVKYTDTSGTTSGGFVNISHAGVPVYSLAVTNSSFTINQSLTIPIGGSSAKVSAHIISGTGTVNKDYTINFIGPAVTIANFDEDLVMWGALFLIVLTGMIAGATTSPQVAVIVCLEAWIFLGIGWLRPLAEKIGDGKLIGLFALATFMAIVLNLREGKRKETGR